MNEDIKKLNFNDADYPSFLKNTANPPSDIFVKGGFSGFEAPAVAIVGTRKATREGLKLASEMAENCARMGFTVVSGLAYGIDTAAHQGALSAGGLTLAVLAHGLDTIYPRSNEGLAKTIMEGGGALVSEYDAGTPPYQNQFLERNRIVAGLAIATIVVEAPIHSGALATARYAVEAGREVFVAPGPYYSKNHAGSHGLIRKGARLITGFEDFKEDVLEMITNEFPDIRLSKNEKDDNDALDEKAALVFNAIKSLDGTAEIDKLAEMVKLEPQEIFRIITDLTLSDRIVEVRGGFMIKK